MSTRSDNERQMLCDILPLDAPLSVYIQSSNICNFKCKYCSQVLDNASLKNMLIERKVMTLDLFQGIVEDLMEFSGAIKTINLTGFGEPLMNLNISKMVGLCKRNALSQRTEIVTNGSLLTHACSDGLIEAGLDLLRVSVQGLTVRKYKEISNVAIDLERFIENIAYFFHNKKHTKLYIKILDSGLADGETNDDFFQIFGDICDAIAVEHLVPVMPGVNYSSMGRFDRGMVGYKNEDIMVCPRPFYMMTVNIDGSVRPCCNYQPPMILGNVSELTLKEMWNGDKMKGFRLMMLERTRKANPTCRNCQTPVYGLHGEDNLDNQVERVASLYR